MHVKTLKVMNFKSIKSLKLSCRRLNLFIGEPNTGKSNILEALGLLSHVMHGSIKNFARFEVLNDLFYDKVLDDPIEIGFDKSTLEVSFKDGKFNGFLKTLGKDKNLSYAHVFNYDYYGDGSTTRDPRFHSFKFYRFFRVSEFRDQKSEFLAPPYGGNLLAVIMSKKRLKGILNDLFRKFGYRTVFKPQEGRIEILKELEDVIISLPYSLASETLQRLVFYLAAIYSNQDSILAFEEPEAHAFPYYTKYLAERISLDEGNNQFFITTHNPYFLMSVLEKAPKKEVAIFVTSFQNYETKAELLTEKQKAEILEMGTDVFFNIKKFLKY